MGNEARWEEQRRRYDGRGCCFTPGRCLRSDLLREREETGGAFLVEDNAYGISSPTRKINPLALDVLQPNDWRTIDGHDVEKVYEASADAIARMRAGEGPAFFW